MYKSRIQELKAEINYLEEKSPELDSLAVTIKEHLKNIVNMYVWWATPNGTISINILCDSELPKLLREIKELEATLNIKFRRDALDLQSYYNNYRLTIRPKIDNCEFTYELKAYEDSVP